MENVVENVLKQYYVKNKTNKKSKTKQNESSSNKEKSNKNGVNSKLVKFEKESYLSDEI